MTSTCTRKLTFAVLSTAIMMAFVAAILFATPHGALAAEPERPTDLTATAIDHDTVSLSWTHPDPTTVDHYQVLSRTVGAGTGLLQVGTSTTTSFEHDGLEPESTYRYRIKPVNSAGEEGRRSAWAEATTPTDATPAPEPDPTPVPDPTPAQPQRSDDEGKDNTARASHDVLVRNTGQTSEDNPTAQDRAQTFTTGTNPAGYVLSRIIVGYNDPDGDAFTASVWTTDTSGLPNTLKHSLTAPGTFSQADLTFTAPADATLDASTTYTVKMERTSGTVTYKRTSTINPDEDSGAAAGWSIGDTYHYDAGSTYFPSSSNKPMLIAIHGTLSTGSDDATLSDMTVADSRNFLTLTPSFASGTYAYAAAVDNSDSAVTLNPTVNHSGAGVSGVTLNGTAVTDTDFTDGIDVPSLVVGNNVIVVTVTAEDTATTLTYTVTVARATKPADLLVSNLAQSSNGHGSLNDFDQAQAFTTGSNSAGYTMTRIDIDMEGADQSGSALTATIHADDSGAPGTSLGTLTNPSSFSSNAIYSFTTTGIALDASTTYFVVLDVLSISGTAFSTINTSSDNEDANSETGWTINNGSIYRNWNSTGTWTSFTDSKKIRVRGTSSPSSPSSPPVPQETLTPNQVVYIPADWSLKPAGIDPGERFRLIFLSSTKRDATSNDIETYNTFVQDLASSGHANIQDHSSRFKVVGCTEEVDARDNTKTTKVGIPIYWLGGNKVADNYTDFYDGTWDDEANDKNELGNDAHDTSQTGNFPFTGCKANGTESKIPGVSFNALGETNVRVGQPTSTATDSGPIRGQVATNRSNARPFYALSPIFEVRRTNAYTLSTSGVPHPGKITSDNTTGNDHQVKLYQGVTYQIDVKGSESSQYGGTITNPKVKIFAGNTKLELLNGSSAGVSQTATQTLATGGGTGANSRLIVKAEETQYYDLLVHRASGDNGTYTITVNRLDWPQGRLAPDITVTYEHREAIGIAWAEPAKTQRSLVAPISGYKVQYRTLPDGSWSAETNKPLSQLSHEYTGLTLGQSYEIRVRSYHSNEHPNNKYRWGYATVYADDCAVSGSSTCSIAVDTVENGRINYPYPQDVDGYTVRLISGRTYVIEVNGKSTGDGTLVDPKLTLRTIIGNDVVGRDDNGGHELNAKLAYSPTSTEDYLILVTSNVTREHGTYTVKVTEQ